VVWWGCLRALRVPQAGLITGLTTFSVVEMTWQNTRLDPIPLSQLSAIALWAAVSAGAWTAVLSGPPRSSEPNVIPRYDRGPRLRHSGAMPPPRAKAQFAAPGSGGPEWVGAVRQPCRRTRRPLIGYLFHCAQDGAWQGVVQALGPSLSHRLPTLTSWGAHMACAGRALHEERERLKRGLLSSK
jgi:hypothetical protein